MIHLTADQFVDVAEGAVPEADMTKRNATMKAIAEDPLLDALGKIELELAYLLRTAVQETGGAL